MQRTNPRKTVALFANPAVDRDYHAYRVMGDWVSHLAFAVCLKDAPLLPRQ